MVQEGRIFEFELSRLFDSHKHNNPPLCFTGRVSYIMNMSPFEDVNPTGSLVITFGDLKPTASLVFANRC